MPVFRKTVKWRKNKREREQLAAIRSNIPSQVGEPRGAALDHLEPWQIRKQEVIQGYIREQEGKPHGRKQTTLTITPNH